MPLGEHVELAEPAGAPGLAGAGGSVPAWRRSTCALEVAIERDFTDDEIATVKAWLVSSAKRLERIAKSRNRIG